jgi:hypothetical protein
MKLNLYIMLNVNNVLSTPYKDRKMKNLMFRRRRRRRKTKTKNEDEKRRRKTKTEDENGVDRKRTGRRKNVNSKQTCVSSQQIFLRKRALP